MHPLPPTLPLPLAHQHGGQHGDHHGDGDDEHSHCLGDAQLAVHIHQRVVVEDWRVLAGQVGVVVQEEFLDAPQLPEDPLQLAVAVPGVPPQQDVGAVGVDAQERLEADTGQLVVHQLQQRHADQRVEEARLHLVDPVPSQVEDFQGAEHGEGAAPQSHQLVVLQVQLPQGAGGGEGPHVDGVDAVVAQV